MAKRNIIFNNIVSHLVEEQKMKNNEAKISAKKALVENRWKDSDDPRQDQFPLCDGSLPKNCDITSEFRTITGICNNLANPYWGASNTPLSREIVVGNYDARTDNADMKIILDHDRYQNGE